MLTEKELQQLSERNITENQVINQVAQLKRGTQYVQLMRPATLGDGILRLDEEQVNMMTAVFDADKEFYQFTKFVPASGAASRMFKDLFAFIETGQDSKFTEIFFAHIHNFAFFDDLNAAAKRLYGADIDITTKWLGMLRHVMRAGVVESVGIAWRFRSGRLGVCRRG